MIALAIIVVVVVVIGIAVEKVAVAVAAAIVISIVGVVPHQRGRLGRAGKCLHQPGIRPFLLFISF